MLRLSSYIYNSHNNWREPYIARAFEVAGRVALAMEVLQRDTDLPAKIVRHLLVEMGGFTARQARQAAGEPLEIYLLKIEAEFDTIEIDY